MNEALIARIKKARQIRIPMGEKSKIVFVCRRPTDAEVIDMASGVGGLNNVKDIKMVELVSKFVEGWEGVLESDCIEGGTDSEVAFSQELFDLWIADRTDAYALIMKGVTDAYNAYKKKKKNAQKK